MDHKDVAALQALGLGNLMDAMKGFGDLDEALAILASADNAVRAFCERVTRATADSRSEFGKVFRKRRENKELEEDAQRKARRLQG